MVVPVAVGAVRVRKRLLPAWSGAPAHLAEATLALALLIGIGLTLGSFGELRRVPVVIACIVLGSAAAVLAKPGPKLATAGRHSRRGAADDDQSRRIAVAREPAAPPARHERPILLLMAAVAVTLLLAAWLPHVITSYERGMFDGDTMWYHAPFAARFVQTGWVTRLLFTNYEPIVTFFPANSELVAALAILPYHYDILLPVINLGWLALALLAGWTIGRRFGGAPIGLCAVAVVMTLPIMTVTQAGTLRNDVAVVALFLTAVALLVNSDWSRAGLALAGLAAGICVGTKVDLIVPAVALIAGIVIAVPRSMSKQRFATTAPCVALAAAAGAPWYIRNLARTGNPLPWFGLHIGPLSIPAAPVATYGQSAVVDHLASPRFWTDSFVPGTYLAFGPAWPLVLGAAAVGTALAIGWKRSPLVRMLGVVAVVCAGAYAVTPNSVPGPITTLGTTNLAGNLRYLAPALALGVVLLSAPPVLRATPRRVAVMVALLCLIAADQDPLTWLRDPEMSLAPGALAWGIAAAIVLLLFAVWLATWSSRPRYSATTAAAIAALCIGAGFPVQRAYLADRYKQRDFASAMGALYPRAQSLHDQRIAITGDLFQYPFYGNDLSNWVQTVGDNGPHGSFEPVTSCQSWREKLGEGRYSYVAVAPPVFVLAAPRELAWTRSDPAATEVDPSSRAGLFKLVAAPSTNAC